MPVVIGVPPVLAPYHLTVVPFEPGEAPRLTVPDPQMAGAEVILGSPGTALTVPVTGTLALELSHAVVPSNVLT